MNYFLPPLMSPLPKCRTLVFDEPANSFSATSSKACICYLNKTTSVFHKWMSGFIYRLKIWPWHVRLIIACFTTVAAGCSRDIPHRPETDATKSPALSSASCSLYFADYRKVSPSDPGSVRVHFNVPSGAPAIKEILFSGHPIPVWGVTNLLVSSLPPSPNVAALAQDDVRGDGSSLLAAKSVTWARLRYDGGHDGGLAELVVKLVRPLATPVKVTVIDLADTTFSTVVRPLSRRLTIDAVRFLPDMSAAYCHLRWIGHGDGDYRLYNV